MTSITLKARRPEDLAIWRTLCIYCLDENMYLNNLHNKTLVSISKEAEYGRDSRLDRVNVTIAGHPHGGVPEGGLEYK